MLPEMLTGPNQAGLDRIDATRGIMYVVNSGIAIPRVVCPDNSRIRGVLSGSRVTSAVEVRMFAGVE